MTESPRTITQPAPDDVLATLACEVNVRSEEAPHFQHVEHAVRGTRREEGALLVEYAAEVAPTLERVVEAEKLCCAEIGWSLEPPSGDHVCLRITATPEQLDTLEELFSSSLQK